MGNMFFFSNVSVIRDGNHILDSINLRVRDGESISIIGPNGSGKTTLIGVMRGDIHPYYDESIVSKSIIMERENWNIFELRRIISSVSMDQQIDFPVDTLVYEVVLSGFFGSNDVYRNSTVTDEMVSSVKDSADRLGIDDLLDRRYGTLSLGEKRRVLISRALVTSPKVLILDEPMTGLDPAMRSRFRKMFDILMRSGVTLCLVTHDPEDIPEGISRVVALKNGQILYDGEKNTVLTSENVSGLYDDELNVVCENGVFRII